MRVLELHLEIDALAGEAFHQMRQHALVGVVPHQVAHVPAQQVDRRQAEPLRVGMVGETDAMIGAQLHDRKRNALRQPLQLELGFGQLGQCPQTLRHVLDHTHGVGRGAILRR